MGNTESLPPPSGGDLHPLDNHNNNEEDETSSYYEGIEQELGANNFWTKTAAGSPSGQHHQQQQFLWTDHHPQPLATGHRRQDPPEEEEDNDDDDVHSMAALSISEQSADLWKVLQKHEQEEAMRKASRARPPIPEDGPVVVGGVHLKHKTTSTSSGGSSEEEEVDDDSLENQPPPHSSSLKVMTTFHRDESSSRSNKTTRDAPPTSPKHVERPPTPTSKTEPMPSPRAAQSPPPHDDDDNVPPSLESLPSHLVRLAHPEQAKKTQRQQQQLSPKAKTTTKTAKTMDPPCSSAPTRALLATPPSSPKQHAPQEKRPSSPQEPMHGHRLPGNDNASITASAAADQETASTSIDLQLVRRFEDVFEDFLLQQENQNHSCWTPQQIDDFKVSHLQALVGIDWAALCKDAARRKAQASLQGQQELEHYQWETHQMQLQMTWEYVLAMEQVVKEKHRFLRRKGPQGLVQELLEPHHHHHHATNDSNEADDEPTRDFVLGEDPLAQAVRDAALAPAGRWSDVQQEDLRQLQVDTALLKSQVRVWQQKLDMMSNNNGANDHHPHVWVESILLRLNDTSRQQLLSKFQEKSGSSMPSGNHIAHVQN